MGRLVLIVLAIFALAAVAPDRAAAAYSYTPYDQPDPPGGSDSGHYTVFTGINDAGPDLGLPPLHDHRRPVLEG